MQTFDELWDYSQPAATESRFRALLPEAEGSGDASYRLELLTQIARAQGLQGNFAGADETLDRVDAATSFDPPARARIRSLIERGRVRNSSGDRTASIEYFRTAWTLAVTHGEEYHAVDAAHMLGIVESPNEQLAWSLRALELAEASDDPRTRAWLGPLYNNLGWTYHELGRYDEALELFRRGFGWRQERNQPRETRIAAFAIARCLRSLGRTEEALDLQRENLQAANAAGEAGGPIEEEIGECLLALGRATEARQHFQRAHTALSSDAWIVEHEAARLERMAELARR